MFQSMRYVYEVYREMSFSRAARNLFISQPSLSAAVKKAEEQIGAPIFDRSTSPIRLTELGREYIRAVEIILDVENGFENYVNDLAEMKGGSLVIGGTNFFASYVLPPLLSRFTAQYPMVRVQLLEATTAELTEKLGAGTLDLLIDNNVLDPGPYGKKTLQQEHLLMAVPVEFASNAAAKNYALTAAEVKAGLHLNTRIVPVPLQHFEGEPFLLLREGNDTRERAMNICRANRFTPTVKLELEQQITAYNLSCYGMGISFIGDSLIPHVPEAKNLLFYKLDSKDAVREVNLYYKRNRYISKAISAFLGMIE